MKYLAVVLCCCVVSLGQTSSVVLVQNQTASHPVAHPAPKPVVVHTVQPQHQTQSQHQQQQQGQSQAQQATANNNQAFSSNYREIRQTPFAFAPEAMSTSPCRVSGSAGVSSPIGAVSLGGSKQDKECDRRETAKAFALLGQYQAALEILCSTSAAKVVKDCANLTPPIVVSDEPIRETISNTDSDIANDIEPPQFIFEQPFVLSSPVVIPRLTSSLRRKTVKHKVSCPK